MFLSINTSLFIPSFNISLMLTFLLLGEILSEVDPPTFVVFIMKSIIRLLLLQTCTSTTLLTSY